MSSSPQEAAGISGELDIAGFLLFLFRNLRLIVSFALVTLGIVLIAVLLVKPRYASTAVVIFPPQQSSASSLQNKLAQVSPIDLLGNNFDIYADILKSRTVRDKLIADFHLQQVYRAPTPEAAEAILANMTKILIEKEGLINITVQDTDRQRAADLANAYVDQLEDLNSRFALSTASRQRAFLERELIKEKDVLADAEVALKQAQDVSAGLPPETQATAGLTALVTTRAQLRADQVQLAALLTGETEANPQVIRLRSEIARLTAQVDTLQQGEANPVNGTPIATVPQQALLYTRRLRDVKFHEALFDLLEKQFAEAKQEESRDPMIAQILDPARPAKNKTWPPRTFACLLALAAGLTLGVLWVSIRAFLQRYVRNPENQQQVEEFRSLFRRKKLSAA